MVRLNGGYGDPTGSWRKSDSGSAALAKLLAAEGYGRPGTRIGVAKLKGSRFDPEGLVSATWLERLKAALPGVHLGHTFDFKPSVALDRAKFKAVAERNRPVQVGESILVTEKGAVRLGTRAIVPIVTLE